MDGELKIGAEAPRHSALQKADPERRRSIAVTSAKIMLISGWSRAVPPQKLVPFAAAANGDLPTTLLPSEGRL